MVLVDVRFLMTSSARDFFKKRDPIRSEITIIWKIPKVLNLVQFLCKSFKSKRSRYGHTLLNTEKWKGKIGYLWDIWPSKWDEKTSRNLWLN
jgi:hypothetical protein